MRAGAETREARAFRERIPEMKRVFRACGLVGAVLLSLCLAMPGQDVRPTREGQPPNVGQAAEPYAVFDTRPVILHGPYLVAPTETSVTITWETDTPCHSKVLYGVDRPNSEAISARDGLLNVGTHHTVHIRGLKPGQTYQFQAVSTRVVKMKGYWSDKGLTVMSPAATFRTLIPPALRRPSMPSPIRTKTPRASPR